MYEERERFSIKDVVLQIILVVLFVFLLLWLFPTKSYVDKKIDSSLQPLYNQIFAQNVDSMKEAAISYFTTSRLPKNIGDKETLTLSQMLDKKLLIPFLDSNNKQCSLTESYVEMTKMDDEYILKVNLDCSDDEDYILVHLGCYSYCSTGLCEKQEPVTPTKTQTTTKVQQLVNKNYEYEYEKVINGKWGDWSEWSSWSTVKVDKTEYRNVKSKQEVEVDGTETIKVGTVTKLTDASQSTSYYCPAGYTKNGTKCTRNVTSTETIDATVNTNNSCPAGYTLSGNNCVRTNSSSIGATASTSYSCPAGYTLSGNSCIKNEQVVSYYKKGGYIKTVYNASYVPKDTSRYFYEMTGSDYVYDCNNSCAFRWVYTYKVYGSTPVYKTNTVSTGATASTKYSCPAGYTLSGTTCYTSSTETIAATNNTKYSCPAGYTLSGTKCSKNVSSVQTINASANTTYSCKVGDLVGKSCVTYEDKYETFNTYKTVTYYSYQEREYISGERKIVWSSSQSDKTLINSGYALTGRSREI